jgi:hypothetical protein
MHDSAAAAQALNARYSFMNDKNKFPYTLLPLGAHNNNNNNNN